MAGYVEDWCNGGDGYMAQPSCLRAQDGGLRHKMKLTVDTIEWTSALELRESECCSVSSCIIMHSMESYSEFGLAVFTVHHEQLRSAFLQGI